MPLKQTKSDNIGAISHFLTVKINEIVKYIKKVEKLLNYRTNNGIIKKTKS